MSVMSLELHGYITGTGELNVQLPDGLAPGKVRVTIEFDEQAEESPEAQFATGAEIVAMLEASDGWWDDESISDGVTWANEVRRKESERRNQQW